ncbi:MAG: oligosaccharide flippase family protein [Butyrivibrio sp.]|nr:oligosaccharide flippase family protein [Acetatifactor muris]MCM1558918.1 oligosaccharide flippase family protein [Butyrivibrio sp.]
MSGGERILNTKRNLIWGGISQVITIVLPFFTRMVLLNTLGIGYDGLGSLFKSVLGVLNFAELGVGSAIVYNMYRPIAANDREKVCALLKLYRKLYLWIGFVVLILGLLILPFLKILIKGDVPGEIDIRFLFLFYVVELLVGYSTFAYRGSVFTAHQRVDITSKIKLIVELFKNIIQILALVITGNYYIYTAVLSLAAALNCVLTYAESRKKYPEYVCRGELGKDELGEIKKNVKGLIFQKIGNVVLQSADTIVISGFLGLAVLGVYNGYWMVILGLTGFINIIHQALVPSVGNSIVMESKEKNYTDFLRFQFIYTWFLGWCSVCLVCLIQPFIELWQGKENMLSNNMALMFGIFLFIHHAGDVSGSYKTAAGIWWQGRIVPLLSAIMNLIINIILVQIIGLYGILLSTILCIGFINIPLGGWILFQCYFRDMKKWRRYLYDVAIYFICTMIAVFLTGRVCQAIHIQSLMGQLVARAAICLVVPNIIFAILYSRNPNFKPAIAFVRRILKRGE